jgi:hypothetical protein
MSDIQVGTFTAVAAENVDVAVGFIPSVVVLLNPATADQGIYVVGGAQLEEVSDVIAAAVDDVIALGTQGGTPASAQGFTLVAGAALNDDTETITYIAMR